ncbi:MAG: hypothetical protein WAU88_01960 [Candidatus Zixiibacteriota bacterium]
MPEFKMEKDDKWSLPIFLGLGAVVGRLFRSTLLGAIGGLVGWFVWKNMPEKNAHVKDQPPTK